MREVPTPDGLDHHAAAAEETDAYDGKADFANSILVAFAAVRERMAAGGPPWVPGATLSNLPRKPHERGD
jgi:hypothetical protein